MTTLRDVMLAKVMDLDWIPFDPVQPIVNEIRNRSERRRLHSEMYNDDLQHTSIG